MALAKTEDVAARLGRELAEEESTAVGFLLDAATAVIEEAVEASEAAELDSPVLRFVTVEVVLRALANPAGVSSRSESLGAYSHSEAFLSGAGLMLTKTEELMVRRAVWGQLSGSVRLPAHVDDVFDALTGGS